MAVALIAVGFAAILTKLALADDTPLAGQWKVEGDADKRKLIITQSGTDLSGKAVRPKGDLAFKFSGSVEKPGQATLKVFFDRSDAPGAPPHAFDEAIKLVANKEYPNLLPAQSKMDFKYDAAKDQIVAHIVKLNIIIHHNKSDGANHADDTIEKINETLVEVTLTRTYASRCAAEMGDIPAFSCLAGESVDLPIKVEDVEQSDPVDKCDRPTQLGQRSDKPSAAQCVPGSRLVRITIPGHGDIETLAICRKYNRPGRKDRATFHDIAMVSYNKKTGHTCFFQSATGDPIDTAHLDATGNIPSPTAENAGVIWQDQAPEPHADRGGTGPDGVRCNFCHSAGPFVWSPYVGQASNIKVSRWGQDSETDPYDSNFDNMFNKISHTFRLDINSNACVECHRIGDGNDCKFVREYTTKPDAKFRTHPEVFWMPLKNNDIQKSGAVDKDAYKPSVDEITACCAPGGPKACNVTNQGTPPPP